jgi:hypothetical protein
MTTPPHPGIGNAWWSFEDSPRTSNATEYYQLALATSSNHLQYGIDSVSTARKKRGDLESQVPRYDPVKLPDQIALEKMSDEAHPRDHI